jgi:hypothetical protein
MLAVRDSVIHSIDTAIHYRQVVHFSPLTNWETQILAHQYNRLQHQFYSLIYQNGRYKLVQTLMQDEPTKPLVETGFVRFRSFGDPLKVYQSDEIELKDTLGRLVSRHVQRNPNRLALREAYSNYRRCRGACSTDFNAAQRDESACI